MFTSQESTLKKLSPQFVAFLKTLKAVHSGVEQADFSRSGRRGGVVRREPVEHVHPLVRKHPVTGQEALYVNRQFTRRIVGLKREESGMSRQRLRRLFTIERLTNTTQKTSSSSCMTTSTRVVTYKRGSTGLQTPLCFGTTVTQLTYVYNAMIDCSEAYRLVSQSAIVDYGDSKERRHGARITPQAERPIPALEGLDLSA